MKDKLIKMLVDLLLITVACIIVALTLFALFGNATRGIAEREPVDSDRNHRFEQQEIEKFVSLLSGGLAEDESGEHFEANEEKVEAVDEEAEDGFYHPKAERYQEIELSDDTIELFAKIVWLESGNQSFEGQKMVAEVILNRVVYGYWGDTVEDVIYAEGQFTTVKKLHEAYPNETTYNVLYAAMDEEPITDADVIFFARSPENSKLFAKVGAHYFCRAYY